MISGFCIKKYEFSFSAFSKCIVLFNNFRLKTFYEVERAKHELEEAHNALESFLVETRDKLYQPEYESVTTEEERQEINDKLSEVSNWLYEDSDGAKTKVTCFYIL